VIPNLLSAARRLYYRWAQQVNADKNNNYTNNENLKTWQNQFWRKLLKSEQIKPEINY